MTFQLATDIEVFAAERSKVQAEREKHLIGAVKYGLRRYPARDWYATVLNRAAKIVREQYHADTGKWTSPRLRVAQESFRKQARDMLRKTKDVDTSKDALNQQATLIARSLATAAINVAEEVAGADSGQDRLRKVWVSMEDADVRPTHAAANGQSVALGETFTVGGHDMIRPGDLRAPIEEWVNCRCVLAIMSGEEQIAAASQVVTDDAAPLVAAAPQPTGVDMDDDLEEFPAPETEEDRVDLDAPVPFWGVLAPEGVESGDGRRFSKGALRARPFPLPLAYQKINEPGHDGSYRVGNIEEAWRIGELTYGRGHFLTTVPEVDEVIGLMAESGGRMGVSIDADDGAMEMHTRDGKSVEQMMEEMKPGDEIELDIDDLITEFTSARVCGGTLCNIPAFHQAFMALGEVPEEFAPDKGEPLAVEARFESVAASGVVTFESIFAVSEKAWDGSASRFTPQEWKRSCILHLSDSLDKADHKLPIREPGGAISRAGVHAAAGRIGQVDAPPAKVSAAKSRLRGAYKAIGEDPPESLTAAAFAPGTEDGPGWLTHPIDTDRLRDYWVRGKGAAKIGWGAPGDFNRCRLNLAKYVKPQYLNGYCANRHKDALGFWPGEHNKADTLVASAHEGEQMAPAITLVAAGPGPLAASKACFEDPGFTGPSPITVTTDGRFYGHAAEWDVCHIGLPGACTVAPHSVHNYAYYRTGSYLTAEGEMIPVGTITLGTGHADLESSPRAAMAHYDNTGTAAAYVASGEDQFGIWVAGVVSPKLSAEDIVELRGAKLSGDWRWIGNDLEMVAALAVNVGGFPVPHTALAASGGHTTALVAAGIVETPVPAQPVDIEAIVSKALEAMVERQKAKDRMAALATRAAEESRAQMDRLRAKVGA